MHSRNIGIIINVYIFVTCRNAFQKYRNYNKCIYFCHVFFRCEFDNVTLSSFLATRGITHCGNWNEKLKKLRWTSNDNTLLLSFITDHSNNYSGFKAKIGYVDNGEHIECSCSIVYRYLFKVKTN